MKTRMTCQKLHKKKSKVIKINITFADDIDKVPVEKKKLLPLCEFVCKKENIGEGEIDIIFVDDKMIHNINRKFLEHDYPTDVITFTLNDDDEPLSGEIYVSVETSEKQSQEFGVSFEDELNRLSVHGILHLAGHEDDTDIKRQNMIDLGDKYIAEIID